MSFRQEFIDMVAARKPLASITLDDRYERFFRNFLANKEEMLIEYLKSREILSEIMDGLINEEGKTVQDAAESLNILLADIDPITDSVIVDHLPTLFCYLNQDTHQPRRVYFFLRVMSFLFQHRSPEMFCFVNQNPDVIRQLVRHIKSPHILQLLLNMLSVERQLRDYATHMPDSTWSEKCDLISKVVEVLEANPEDNLESIQRFFSEVCLSYPSDSEFIRNILLVQNGSLISCIMNLLCNKNTASDAVKLLDQVVFVVLMDNRNQSEFFQNILANLESRRDIFQMLLDSESLIFALAGTKLVQSLLKHQLYDLLLKTGLQSCLSLMKKFKWSNVLHTVISDIMVSLFKEPVNPIAISLLSEYQLADMVIDVLESDEVVGYRGHMRIIANAIKNCPEPDVIQYLNRNERWVLFLPALEQINDSTTGFRDVDKPTVISMV